MAILALTMGPQLGIAMLPASLRLGDAGVIRFRAPGAIGDPKFRLVSSTLPDEWDDAFSITDGIASLSTDEIENAGEYSITVWVSDENRIPVQRTFLIMIISSEPLPLGISGSWPDWIQGVPAFGTLTISGGVLPYFGVTVVSGSLPPGVSAYISGSHVLPNGSPTSTGAWSAILDVEDAAGGHAQISVGSTVWEMWTPTNLPNAAQIWSDWDSTVTNVSGDVSAWENNGTLSGNWIQGDAGARPQILPSELNGLRVLRFDGAGDFMGWSTGRGLMQNVSAGWAFVIARHRSTATVQRAVFQVPRGGSNGVRFELTRVYSGSEHYRLGVRRVDGDSYATIDSSRIPGTSWTLLFAQQQWSSGAGALYEDGDLVASDASLTSSGSTSNSSSFQNYRLGCRFINTGAGDQDFSDMDIAAIIVGAGSIPSEDDRQRLEGWGAYLCGLQSNLPSGHPYKSLPPAVMP